MPAPVQPPFTWTDEERRRIFGPDPPESVAYRQQLAEESERRASLAKERARIRAIAGMVERVNGWERLGEMVDAMLEQDQELRPTAWLFWCLGPDSACPLCPSRFYTAEEAEVARRAYTHGVVRPVYE